MFCILLLGVAFGIKASEPSGQTFELHRIAIFVECGHEGVAGRDQSSEFVLVFSKARLPCFVSLPIFLECVQGIRLVVNTVLWLVWCLLRC